MPTGVAVPLSGTDLPMTEDEALRKALDRERERRRRAETMLEEKSRELFESFEQLEQTLAELKANQKKLVKAEKMASLGIMSAGVAHEINNPVGFALSNIRSLQGSMGKLTSAFATSREFMRSAGCEEKYAAQAKEFEAEMASQGIDEILEDVPDLLTETSDGLVRIKDIVSGLKSFAKKDDVSREPLDLNQITRESVTIARANAPETVSFDLSYGDLPSVRASKTGMSQVVLNLLQNACDAVQEDGAQEACVSVVTSSADGYVRISVKDSGCGMDSEQLDKLFTPFYTTKDVGKGTGLGLSASLGVVEEHGGRIDVESEPGGGARFEVVLPIATGEL